MNIFTIYTISISTYSITLKPVGLIVSSRSISSIVEIHECFTFCLRDIRSSTRSKRSCLYCTTCTTTISISSIPIITTFSRIDNTITTSIATTTIIIIDISIIVICSRIITSRYHRTVLM